MYFPTGGDYATYATCMSSPLGLCIQQTRSLLRHHSALWLYDDSRQKPIFLRNV